MITDSTDKYIRRTTALKSIKDRLFPFTISVPYPRIVLWSTGVAWTFGRRRSFRESLGPTLPS